MSLERKIEISPAYDKRPKYGIHGVEMRWYVIGPQGAIQFLLFTNWHLEHVQKELDAKTDHFACHPLPADIGYHSHVPRYDGQESQGHCHILNGPCYYDGSGLDAIEFYKILVEQGGEALWKALEERYALWLEKEVVS